MTQGVDLQMAVIKAGGAERRLGKPYGIVHRSSEVLFLPEIQHRERSTVNPADTVEYVLAIQCGRILPIGEEGRTALREPDALHARKLPKDICQGHVWLLAPERVHVNFLSRIVILRSLQ